MSSLTTRTARNAVASTLGVVWGTALTLVSTAVLLRAFGPPLYGVYVIIGAAAGYISLVELNLSTALVKYIAEHSGRYETAEIEEVVGTTIFLYLVLSVAAAAAFLLVGRALLPLLHIPDQYFEMAWRALVISALALPLTLLANTLAMIPAALGRFDTSMLTTNAVATASTIAVIVIARSGGTLVPLAIANAAAAAVGAIAAIVVSKRMLPGVSFRPRWIAPRAGVLLRFSAFSFVGRLSGTLLITVDRIVVGLILGPAAVTYYAVPAGLVRRMAALLSRMAYVMLPVASALTGSAERLQRGYVRSARITWCIAVALAVTVALLARPLLALWVGPEVADRGAWVLRILALSFLFEAVSNVPAVITEGMGLPRITARFAIATTVISLGLLVPAIHLWGVNGAALSVLIATALTGPLFVHYAQRRILGLGWRETLRAVYAPPLALVRDDVREIAKSLR